MTRALLSARSVGLSAILRNWSIPKGLQKPCLISVESRNAAVDEGTEVPLQEYCSVWKKYSVLNDAIV